jgi:hypothetical protein
MSDFKYRAYISYNHKDGNWVRWLHRALETYRIPKNLAGSDFGHGTVPKRLQPVFRDRDELGSATDLSHEVRDALAASETMVVVCSPNAVASQWVNEEIREFRRLGRGHRIFAVIIDGDPQSQEADACFPGALIRSEDGSRAEPLAADARKWADGRRLAILKLVSGILGIPLDSLSRRDLQRRQRNWVITTIGLVAVSLILALAVTSRIAAEKRRQFAEELVGFKLNDLDGRIELPRGFNILARLDEWSEEERESAVAKTVDLAISEARRLRSQGLESRRVGDSQAALNRFRRSWMLLATHYASKPGDKALLFELGQAEFWIGQVFVEQGQYDQAEASWSVYADISRRLIRSAPEDADAVLEMAYSLTNLGLLEQLRSDTRPDKAMQFMQSALEFNQIALVLDPGSELYRIELEQSHANMADAQMQVCDLGGALHSRMESVRLARGFLDDSPSDQWKRQSLAYTLGGLANVQISIGLADQAGASLEESIVILQELSDETPENNQFRLLLLERRSRLLDVLIHLERFEQAEVELQDLEPKWALYLASEPGEDTNPRVFHAEFQLIKEVWWAEQRDADRRRKALELVLAQMLSVLEKAPDIVEARQRLALAAYRYWVLTGVFPDTRFMQELPERVSLEAHRRSCFEINLAARLAVMQGDEAAAESYTSFLLAKGYYEPGFIRFCRAHDLCDG